MKDTCISHSINKIRLLPKLSDDQLSAKADQIRKAVVDVAVKNGAGHIAPSLSCIDILTALYYNILNLAESPTWEERDRLIFSKAHGCYGLYGILADLRYLRQEDWETFGTKNLLSGCLERHPEFGIEAGCGSLGHGLPMAAGLAFGAKLQHKPYRIYCLVGDGELQEGSNWEAIQFAVKHKLSNLTVIVDNNKLQAMDFLENILTVAGRKDDLQKKLEAFGVMVGSCNGHQVEEITAAIQNRQRRPEMLNAPRALIANTIKGYGLLCMENIPKFHYRLPDAQELKMGNRYE